MSTTSKTLSIDDVPEVPIGYKVVKKGVTLEVKEYAHDRMWCHCSACGYVVPALESYTIEKLESWFDLHISLFPKEHAKEGVMANESHVKRCFNCKKKIEQPVLYKGYAFCSEQCKKDFMDKHHAD